MTAPHIFSSEIPCPADDCEDGVVMVEIDHWDGTEIRVERCKTCKGSGSLEYCAIDQQVLDDCDDIAACVAQMAALDESCKADEAIFRQTREAVRV